MVLIFFFFLCLTQGPWPLLASDLIVGAAPPPPPTPDYFDKWKWLAFL
jgi:hypothetical protein